MKFFNGFLFAVGLLALPVATSQALAAAKAQTLTTGNNAWDVASTSLGVTGVTTVALYNSGSVTVHVAFATAAPTDPEYILGAGERLTLTFPRTSSPSVIWTKGVSAAGTLRVTAANSGIDVAQDSTPDALAAALSQVKVRTFTVTIADLGEADTSEDQTDPAGALPSGAVLMGYRKRVTTAFSGGGNSAVTVDCGFNGLADVVDDGQTVFTGVAAATYGAGVNALPTVRRAVGGLTPQCTFVTVDGTNAGLTAGEAAFDFFYAVPTSG